MHDPWNSIATALAQEDWKRAETLLRQEQARPDAPVQAAYNLAKVLHEQGADDDAVSYFQKATEVDAAYTPAWFELGRMLVNAGRYEAALEAFRQAADRAQQDPDAWYNRMMLCDRLGAWQEALLCAGRLRALGAMREGLDTLEARFHAERGDLETARKWFSSAIASAPNKAVVLKAMTRCAKGRVPLTKTALHKMA